MRGTGEQFKGTGGETGGGIGGWDGRVGTVWEQVEGQAGGKGDRSGVQRGQVGDR